MAAYSLSVPADLSSATAPFGRGSTRSIAGSVAAHRSSGRATNLPRAERRPRVPAAEQASLDLIWGSVLESMPQGVIVLSSSLIPLYWNHKAKELCRELTERNTQMLPELPTVVSEVGHRLLRCPRSTAATLMLECQSPQGQTIRISAQWLSLPMPADPSTPYSAGADGASRSSFILVFLDNCTEALYTELRIEQRKYDLTEREAEVWMLLRQEYTYQEIAKLLQISLNTVKTHVKNLYAKKRSCSEREKFWYSE